MTVIVMYGIKAFMKVLILFIKEVWRNFVEDGCLYRASSLAFTSLLGLVPLMAVGIFILSFFPQVQFIGAKVQTFIFHNLVASSGQTLEKYVELFSSQVRHMSWIGICALFIVVALLMFSIEGVFNKIWKIPKRPGKYAFIRAMARQWLMLFTIPFLLGLSLALSSYLATLKILRSTIIHVDIPSILLMLIPALLLYCAFVALYKFLPATYVRSRHAMVGGLISTILFILSKEIFKLYIYLFPTYKILYGAFAAIPLFLLWDYIVWLIVLFAAEVTWLLGHKSSGIRRLLP